MFIRENSSESTATSKPRRGIIKQRRVGSVYSGRAWKGTLHGDKHCTRALTTDWLQVFKSLVAWLRRMPMSGNHRVDVHTTWGSTHIKSQFIVVSQSEGRIITEKRIHTIKSSMFKQNVRQHNPKQQITSNLRCLNQYSYCGFTTTL